MGYAYADERRRTGESWIEREWERSEVMMQGDPVSRSGLGGRRWSNRRNGRVELGGKRFSKFVDEGGDERFEEDSIVIFWVDQLGNSSNITRDEADTVSDTFENGTGRVVGKRREDGESTRTLEVSKSVVSVIGCEELIVKSSVRVFFDREECFSEKSTRLHSSFDIRLISTEEGDHLERRRRRIGIRVEPFEGIDE